MFIIFWVIKTDFGICWILNIIGREVTNVLKVYKLVKVEQYNINWKVAIKNFLKNFGGELTIKLAIHIWITLDLKTFQGDENAKEK